MNAQIARTGSNGTHHIAKMKAHFAMRDFTRAGYE